ncbi:nucleoside-diphosphate-sugar epimerase family protein [Thelonectria olida]|uniref:Nucleoside-diphosphate-sugar epimerase family protein n=1 Tax=Thelonectria olida TaxID=1576542 RepID=A0A9P8VZ63_9HYPO|nr:nucleoside-diphosphate-sugar epimerase family protein [Thelonectria olida]
MSRALLITGATGKQGGSVISSLLARNADFKILAVTRNSSSPAAQRLAAKSTRISLVQGDLNDTESIFEAAKKATSTPIWGIFSVQLPAMNKKGPIIEEAQGKALVDSALNHGVKHFVYSSVDRHGAQSINNQTKIPHFASKHRVEYHLIDKTKKSDMSWTILRPVAFMENFQPGFVGKVFATAWRDTVKSRGLQLVSTEDIGAFAALSFLDPERFAAQSISLAGDELTYEQLVEAFKKTTGGPPPVTFSLVSKLVLWLSEEMGTMFEFFEKEGYDADIPALRKMYPELKDLGAWLESSSFAKT